MKISEAIDSINKQFGAKVIFKPRYPTERSEYLVMGPTMVQKTIVKTIGEFGIDMVKSECKRNLDSGGELYKFRQMSSAKKAKNKLQKT
jgi:hypothetical protein